MSDEHREEQEQQESTETPRVFTGFISRRRRGHRYAFTDTPPEPPPRPTRRPARVAQMLALAHRFQRAIDAGEYRDQAEIARQLGFTRARVTQLLGLTTLAPDIQEELAFLDAVDGVEPLSERALRAVTWTPSWAERRRTWTVSRPRHVPILTDPRLFSGA